MTAEIAMRVGQAAGRHFMRGDHRHRVVIGKDTRLSGYMMESALVAGFTSVGMDVIMTGPLPTPAIALLTKEMRADMGVMISASHNRYEDNGIKLFGPDGFKLSDEAELAIEEAIMGEQELAPAPRIGRARRIDDAQGRYIHAVKQSVSDETRFDDLKVVVDCAHGAAYRAAPEVLWELGADVIPIGVAPNGFNINDGCGSTKPELCAQTICETGADVGICLDGDADRVMMLDETGAVADGDQIMALFATRWAESGRLRGNALVATVMSNLGLEQFLNARGIDLLRTSVGDRYVVEAMRKGNFNLGGEQSGHIVFRDFVTTGDGLIAGLQFLAAMVEADKPASALANVFDPVPQLLKNVRFSGGADPLAADAVKSAIADGEASFGASGRLVIRKSGTEPLIRVMGECEDEALLGKVVDAICAEVSRV